MMPGSINFIKKTYCPFLDRQTYKNNSSFKQSSELTEFNRKAFPTCEVQHDNFYLQDTSSTAKKSKRISEDQYDRVVMQLSEALQQNKYLRDRLKCFQKDQTSKLIQTKTDWEHKQRAQRQDLRQHKFKIDLLLKQANHYERVISQLQQRQSSTWKKLVRAQEKLADKNGRSEPQSLNQTAQQTKRSESIRLNTKQEREIQSRSKSKERKSQISKEKKISQFDFAVHI